MEINRIIAGWLSLLLAACTINPTPPALTNTPAVVATQSPSLPAQITPSETLLPTLTASPTPAPEFLLKAADQSFINGDYVTAQNEYQQALSTATDPETRAAALWGLGRVEYEAGNNGKALIDLSNLTNTYSGNINAARAYFIIGEIYMSLERYTESAQAFSAYLALRPGVLDSFTLELRGDAFNDAGNFAEALSSYKAALEAPHISDDIALQIKIAEAYTSTGDVTTALNMYNSIYTSSSNDYTKAQMDLLVGRLFLSQGQTDQAYQHFLDAVNNYPLSYDSYSALVTLVNNNVPVDDLNRGLADYFAGQYGYASDAFHRYITANPKNDGTAFFYHAMALLKLGQFQEGVNELTSFIANYPENKNWHSAWGEKAEAQWSELGDYAGAAQTYLDYAKADPDILFAPQSILNAGRVYERANRLDDAASVWESLADSYPGSDLVPQALFWAGIVHYRAVEFTKALVSFQRDLQFSTSEDDQARAYFWMGKTERMLSENELANSSWQQSASLDMTDYYSLRSQDMLLKRAAFTPPPATNFSMDQAGERSQAEAWLRVTFNLPTDTDLSNAGNLLSDPRCVRGTELWNLGLEDEARLEFEDLRTSLEQNPADSYRLANYLLDLGLYRSAITAMGQVLLLAGMKTRSQMLSAPVYFNHVRFGLYYQDLIVPVAIKDGFDPLFLFSVIWQESNFEGFVRSSAGARGLMQITPDTGQYISDNLGWPPNYTSNDLYLPSVSIALGTSYLEQQFIRFDNDLFTTLAAYNAGPEAASIWHTLSGQDSDLFVETIRLDQTHDYILNIYEIYNIYRSLYGTIS